MVPDKETIEAKLAGFSITTGEAMGNDYVCLALTSDKRLAIDPEDHHSYMSALFNGAVILRENVFPITSQTSLPLASEVISISAGGSVRRSSLPPRGAENEPMVGEFSGKKVYGRTRLTEVACIDGIAYAVGTRCAVYRRRAAGQWECIDDLCYQEENFSRGFNAIDGFGQDEIYAVGELGEIWRYDGTVWKEVSSPTSCSLNTITCAANGIVYAAGARGTVVLGRGDQWRVLSDLPQGLEFWGSAYYQDVLYLTANTRSVHMLDANATLTTVDFGSCRRPLTAYHLKVRDSALWLFGSKDIRRLSANSWIEVATLS